MKVELGGCLHCQRNWRIAPIHETPYRFAGHIPMESCFPLCEECWQSMSLETRLLYYRVLFEEWKQMGPQKADTWLLIEEAVRKGL